MLTSGKTWFSVGLLAVGGMVGAASADTIQTSNSGNLFGDNYSYLFTIEDNADPLLFHATLTNTSPDDGDPDPLIDLLAFNIFGNPQLGVDFFVENVTPNWDFGPPTGMGVEFHYLGEASSPFERLMPFEMLTFDIRFAGGSPSLSLFLNAPITSGMGIGGGDDQGQVAVSFQQLGDGGEFSDLLASNWEPDVSDTTEPSALVLLGTGLLGIASLLRRRRGRG